MLKPTKRMARVRELVEEGKFFTLASGRQTGKTTIVQHYIEFNNRRYAIEIKVARDAFHARKPNCRLPIMHT
jgi:DNA transposition AAA+ family ATPase